MKQAQKQVNKKMCKTCIFWPDQQVISIKRLSEIQKYLISGTQHRCHTTNKICRGARNFQLQIFFRLGFIEAETDQALEEKAAFYKTLKK